MVVLSKEKAAYKQNWDKIATGLRTATASSKARSRPSSKAASSSTSASKPSCPARRSTSSRRKISSSSSATPTTSRSSKSTTTARTSSSPAASSSSRSASEKRQKFLESVKIGDTVKGAVKNITDFGAFIDLDGMDGLLHITDMTWGRLGHPSELLKVGQEARRPRPRHQQGEGARLPRPEADPEESVGRDRRAFPGRPKVKGKVTNLVPYGAFVEIEEGVEGLIHVSELSWTKRITRPSRRAHRRPGSRSRRARRQQGRAENLPRRPPARAESLGRDRDRSSPIGSQVKGKSAT